MIKFLDAKARIIYSQIPIDINFIAQDGDGKFHGYHLKPSVSDNLRYAGWCKGNKDTVKPVELGDGGYNSKWKKSLVELPKIGYSPAVHTGVE